MARAFSGVVAVAALLLCSAHADEQCDQDSLLALSHRKRVLTTENKSRAVCGNTGQTCEDCQVCVGGMKSYACAGSCAVNDACGPGDSPGSCPTCADRAKTLVDNGMGVQDAMAAVGQNYGYSEPGCKCFSSPPESCYCGNTGQQCSLYETCVGSQHSYACAGSCATSEACGPGDTAGSCPTCADRVKTFTDNLMLASEAMDSVACSYSSCRCMKDFCGNIGYPCCGGEVCVGGMKSYACAGSCGTNEACGPGDTTGSCPTCADRVETLVDNGLGVQDAMSSVGQNYGWSEPGCSCMK